MTAPVTTSPVRVYDGTPYLDAVAEIRKTTPEGPQFKQRRDAAYEAARLPQMSAEMIARDDAARAAHEASSRFLDQMGDAFGRSSWDGDGAALNVAVHVPSPWPGPSNDNLDAYGGQGLRGGDGQRIPVTVMNGVVKDGRRVTAAQAEGVMAHEITHMVWEDEVGYTKTERPWRQALNEAWADALPFAFDDDWIMGENPQIGLPGWRDLTKPQYKTLAELPAPVDHLPDGQAWSHVAADTLNQPMVAFATRFGRSSMGQVWYDALANIMNPKRIGVKDAARATLRAAAKEFGRDSEQVRYLAQEWNEIGVKVSPPRT